MSETETQKIPTPPGYSELVPFNRQENRGMGRRREAPSAFARQLNSIYITAVEFFQAARSYPIVFGRDARTGSYVPVAITGLEKDENLFVDADGKWLRDNYVPAYVRRWPFFVVQAEAPDQQEPQHLVCVDPAGLERNDHPLVDDEGNPTAAWQDMEKLIQDMESARQQTVELVATLDRLELIEPFEAHAVAKGGGNMRLGGMFRVNENKLNALPEKTIKQLMKKGQLSRIYAHLISLDSFQRLLNLRLERQQDRGEA